MARTGEGKTAVVGWGRGMGHKGHMYLASSVITHANQLGADPYFVVSKTVGKDDPITPDEKIAIYKKVFPQSGHIFQPATDEIPDLTRVLANLNQQGYTSVTVVLGADQVKAFQYLKNYNNKPDKSGNILYNFDNLDVISRQETDDPSKDQEGPRATPMRQALMDPNKSEEEQFQVWRDAMSPQIGDDEVRDLMTKAKERMTAMSAPKPKKAAKAEPVNELSSEKLGQYKKAAGAQASAADKAGDFKKADKRFSGIVKATKKQFANDEKSVAEGAPIVVAQAPIDIRNPKKALQPFRNQGDIVPPTKPPSTEKRGVKGRPGQRPMPKHDEGVAVEPDPTGYQKDLLTTPKNSLVIDTPGDLDWYKLGQHYPTLGTDDPHEYGQGDSDMMIVPFSKQELVGLKQKLDRLKMRYKDIGGGHEQPEIHDKVEEKIKGADGKSCWDGYRYNGTKNGKDSCVKVSEGVEDIMDALINKIITNEAIQNNRK